MARVKQQAFIFRTVRVHILLERSVMSPLIDQEENLTTKVSSNPPQVITKMLKAIDAIALKKWENCFAKSGKSKEKNCCWKKIQRNLSYSVIYIPMGKDIFSF